MSKPRIRMAVCYPNHGNISPMTSDSVEKALKCPEISVDFRAIQSSTLPQARNTAINGGGCDLAKQSGFNFDYLLMVDADIEFEPENVLALLSHDKPVVSGAYAYRMDEMLMVAGQYGESGVPEVERFLSMSASGLQKVDWVGAGFLLIKKEVFERMDYPWFRDTVHNYKDRNFLVAEDVGFCFGARNAGYDIYVDCDCKVKHHVSYSSASPLSYDHKNITAEMGALREEYQRHLREINNRKNAIESAKREIYYLEIELSNVQGQMLMGEKILSFLASKPSSDMYVGASNAYEPAAAVPDEIGQVN